MRKKLKKIEKDEDGYDEVKKEPSAMKMFIKGITSDKAKLALVIIGALMYIIVSYHYTHVSTLLVTPGAIILGYTLFKKFDKKNTVTILEKPPNKSPRIMYADRQFYAELEHKDEPATLEEPEYKVEEIDGKQKVAMKGIETTRNGGKLVVCQDFNPEEGYILHGWLDGMTYYDYIMERSTLERVTALAQWFKAIIIKEQVDARYIAMQQEEGFIEKWSELPEDKRDPRDFIKDYENKRRMLGLVDND